MSDEREQHAERYGNESDVADVEAHRKNHQQKDSTPAPKDEQKDDDVEAHMKNHDRG
jgi:hypothetical protein